MATEKKPARSVATDPYLSFRFKVEIEGLVAGGFNEVTGLTFETEVKSFREGGGNFFEQKLPGASKYPSNLVLKRGLADAEALWSWYEDVTWGAIERKEVSILLLDPGSDQERWRWVFRQACPVKWSGPAFRGSTAEIAFESVELVHKGLLYAMNQKRSG